MVVKYRIGNRTVELGDRVNNVVVGALHKPVKTVTTTASTMNDAFTIYGLPIGKPRMTRSDKWKQRPCVMRYWAWCDLARQAAFGNKEHKQTLDQALAIEVTAYFQRKGKAGPHTQKPDGDNCLKAVCDALFTNDEMLYKKLVSKWWTDGQSRVEVRLLA